jgi:hypothetical protein
MHERLAAIAKAIALAGDAAGQGGSEQQVVSLLAKARDLIRAVISQLEERK